MMPWWAEAGRPEFEQGWAPLCFGLALASLGEIQLGGNGIDESRADQPPG